MLLRPMLHELIGKPHENVSGIADLGRRRWHVLATSRALCRGGAQVVVVANSEFGNH